MRRWALGLALTAVVAGCGPSPERAEAERLLATLDRVSSTELPLASRLEALEALRREAPEGALAQEARRACLAAYGPMFEARASLDAIHEPLSVADGQRLAEAQRSLAAAESSLPDCHGAQGRLRLSLR